MKYDIKRQQASGGGGGGGWGAAGGSSYITWINTGTRYGAIT